MTISKYDKYAILPKRCNKCNRLFILEPYNIYYKQVGIPSYDLKQIKCLECINKQNQPGRRERSERINEFTLY